MTIKQQIGKPAGDKPSLLWADSSVPTMSGGPLSTSEVARRKRVMLGESKSSGVDLGLHTAQSCARVQLQAIHLVQGQGPEGSLASHPCPALSGNLGKVEKRTDDMHKHIQMLCKM